MNKQFILTLIICNESDAMIPLNVPTETIRAADILELVSKFTILAVTIQHKIYEEAIAEFTKRVNDDIPF